MSTFHVRSDIPAHAGFIIRYATEGFPANFLYYLTVYFFSGLSTDLYQLKLTSVVVLAAATFFKYYVVKLILQQELPLSSSESKNFVIPFFSALLLITFSLPSSAIVNGMYYIGSYPPNVWHNSTTIFTMPWAILLFWLAYKQLEHLELIRTIPILILIALNVTSKPSFLFVFIPAFPIMLFLVYRFKKEFWLGIAPVAFAALGVLVAYVFIFILSVGHKSGNKVGISLFYLADYWVGKGNPWRLFLAVTTAIAGSYFFPFILLFRQRELLKQNLIRFALLCSFFAVVIAQSFIEFGSRMNHGNFRWQGIMTSFILFFVCILELLKLIQSRSDGWKAYRIELAAFGIHVFFGIVYLIKLYVTSRIL